MGCIYIRWECRFPSPYRVPGLNFSIFLKSAKFSRLAGGGWRGRRFKILPTKARINKRLKQKS